MQRCPRQRLWQAVRLIEQEVRDIKETAAKLFGRDAEVRLFGSRVNDDALGGDIDLYILTKSAEKTGLLAELAFNVELHEKIGEQKIDLVVHPLGAHR